MKNSHELLRWSMSVLLLIETLLTGALYAESSATRNFFGVYASGGYSNILTHDKLVTPVGFIGGAAGLGYEMHAKNNFWWSVMGEMQFMTSVLAINNGGQLISDDVNRLSTMEYKVTSWEDYPHCIFISLPVMFGYRNRGFYFGLGPKLSFFSYGKSISTLDYAISNDASSGDYSDYTVTRSATLKTNPYNVAACFEIGGIVYDPSNYIGNAGRERGSYNSNVVVKLGFYAEYWFLNMNMSQGQSRLVSINQNETRTLDIVPLFVSNAMSNTTVNPVFAGLKLTILYSPDNSKNCHCLAGRR